MRRIFSHPSSLAPCARWHWLIQSWQFITGNPRDRGSCYHSQPHTRTNLIASFFLFYVQGVQKKPPHRERSQTHGESAGSQGRWTVVQTSFRRLQLQHTGSGKSNPLITRETPPFWANLLVMDLLCWACALTAFLLTSP